MVTHLLAKIVQVGHILKKDLALALFALLEPDQNILMVPQFVRNAVQELIQKVIHLLVQTVLVDQLLKKDLVLALFALLEPAQNILMALQVV